LQFSVALPIRRESGHDEREVIVETLPARPPTATLGVDHGVNRGHETVLEMPRDILAAEYSGRDCRIVSILLRGRLRCWNNGRRFTMAFIPAFGCTPSGLRRRARCHDESPALVRRSE
jgi:hypothetical protein